MRQFLTACCLGLTGCLPAAWGADPFAVDFEAGGDLAAYPSLTRSGGLEFSVVPREDTGGHCLQVVNLSPSRYCTALFQLDVVNQQNLTISFDCRAAVLDNAPVAYLGVLLYDADDKQFFGLAEFKDEWQRVELPVASLRPTNQGTLSLGQRFVRLSLYGRARGNDSATMRVQLDNVSLGPRSPASRLQDTFRVSTANPPFFSWPAEDGPQRIALSRSPEFPPDQTIEASPRGNWYTPDQALEPGEWYWRIHTESELWTGWSSIGRVIITPEAHRFPVPPLDLTELAQRRWPRLTGPGARPTTDPAEAAALARRVASECAAGIEDDCPIFEAGDPRWPTWIDWYGKAHGGITSRAGTRLQQVGEAVARHDNPESVRLATELALKAARWDPEGGSHISRGDIGAQHFLRGLSACYDALRPHLSEADRTTLRDALVVRARQFWKHDNPFRGQAENNHAWLRTLALGEAGLVLAGDLPEAVDWVQYALEIYIGRFLCTLGYQGENNEGISYWGYGLMFVIHYAELMRRVTGIDLFQHPWLAKTAHFPLYTAIPGAYAVSFANTGQPNHGTRGPAATTQVRRLALATGDPYAMWYAGIWEPVNGIAPKPPVDLPQSIHYRYIGWSVHHTDLTDGSEGVTVAMRSGPFYAGHQHEDLNSFVIHAAGEKLAIDGGGYDWYGSEHFKNWSTLTRAHNTILVNGQDQNSRRPGADGRIAAWFDSPAFGYTVGDASNPEVYAGQVRRFDRRLLFVKPGFVIVQDSLAASAGPARWDWLLHSVAPIATDQATSSFAFTSGRAALHGRFVAPADLALTVTSGFPENAQPVDRYSTRPAPPERAPEEWHLAATPAAPREEETFLAVMQVAVDDEPAGTVEPLAVEHGVGARFQGGDVAAGLVLARTSAAGRLAGGGASTDGELLCLVDRGAGWSGYFAAAAREVSLAAEGGAVLRASAPVTVSFRSSAAGWLVELTASEPTTVGLRARSDLPAARLNGQPVALTREGEMVTLTVPAGEHSLVAGADPDSLLDRALAPVALRVGDDVVELTGYRRHLANSHRDYHWGGFTLAAANRFTVGLDGPADGVSLSLDGQPVAVGDQVWLLPGAHWLQVVGRSPAGVSLKPQGAGATQATLLPKTFRPAGSWPACEAETPVAEGPVRGQIMEKVGATGGIAHCVWDTLGQWAEWQFTVATAGRYRLLIRGCGEHDDVYREIEVNGQPLSTGLVRLGSTGGWSRIADDWRWFRVEQTVELAAGQHRLRLIQAGGSLNLDQLAWQPEG